jgi:nicotinamidase-related amidase
LLVDPYNDFLSEGGKIWPRVQPVAEQVGLLDHLRSVVTIAREAGDYETWDHPNPTQRGIMERHSFARGTWGGEFHPDFQPRPGDIVAREHWAQSGFANTDLDFQLKQHGITHVVLVGPDTDSARWRGDGSPPRRSGRRDAEGCGVG